MVAAAHAYLDGLKDTRVVDESSRAIAQHGCATWCRNSGLSGIRWIRL